MQDVSESKHAQIEHDAFAADEHREEYDQAYTADDAAEADVGSGAVVVDPSDYADEYTAEYYQEGLDPNEQALFAGSDGEQFMSGRKDHGKLYTNVELQDEAALFAAEQDEQYPEADAAVDVLEHAVGGDGSGSGGVGDSVVLVGAEDDDEDELSLIHI